VNVQAIKEIEIYSGSEFYPMIWAAATQLSQINGRKVINALIVFEELKMLLQPYLNENSDMIAGLICYGSILE
jgi:hypothetical protein